MGGAAAMEQGGMSGHEESIREREAELRTSINQKLTETGEMERLKELLREKLLESGWREELKKHCAEVIKQKGLDEITLEGLVDEITPHARETVPDYVKMELLRRIRKFLHENNQSQEGWINLHQLIWV